MGYKWMIRFDDDSEIHYPIPYNLFDHMRTRGKLYGFRQYAEECGFDKWQFSRFASDYFTKHQGFSNYTRRRDYCDGIGGVGYYTNFYIAELQW